VRGSTHIFMLNTSMVDNPIPEQEANKAQRTYVCSERYIVFYQGQINCSHYAENDFDPKYFVYIRF